MLCFLGKLLRAICFAVLFHVKIFAVEIIAKKPKSNNNNKNKKKKKKKN